MMTTTMLFLMRNMEKSGNQVLRTISTWMKSKLHEGWQLTFNQKKLNKTLHTLWRRNVLKKRRFSIALIVYEQQTNSDDDDDDNDDDDDDDS